MDSKNIFIARYTKAGINRSLAFSRAEFTEESAKTWLNAHDIQNFFLFFDPYEPVLIGENSVLLKGDVGFDITTENILKYIGEGKDIILDTFGGDLFEGWKIHDAIKFTGSNPSIGIIGSCVSSGMQILLATENRWISKNSRTLIHNPWTFEVGDDEQMKRTGEQLEGEKLRLADLYAAVSGRDQVYILDLMKKEIFLDSKQSLEMNFAKEIKSDFNNTNTMTNDELNTKIEEKSEGIFAKIKALFKKQGVIKDLVLKTADDQNLDFGEEVQEASQIAVGSTATVDGKPAEGEYTMPDGTIYVFAGGKVTEIKPPAEPEPAPAEDEAAKALKAENETLKSQLTEAQDTLKAVKEELDAFKAEITSDIKGLKPEPPITQGAEVIRKPFKTIE